MSEFTYKSPYGEYNQCFFQSSEYENGNLAIEIWSNEVGPVTRVTVNPGHYIPKDYIAIKDYSENEGMVKWLLDEGIIEGDPIQLIQSGWVVIPVYKLSDYGKSIL